MLEADPDLGERLTPQQFVLARERCTAPVFALERQALEAWVRDPEAAGPVLGLLVLEGTMTRRIEIHGRDSAELLGRGDVLRPWSAAGEGPVVAQSRWRVHSPGAAVVLDAAFHTAASPWPQIASALLERTMWRARSLMIRLAIAEEPTIVARVRLLLWHLGDRWGRVTPDGVLVELRLSRKMLADLVCSTRESASRALGELGRRDLVQGEPGRIPAARPLARRCTPSSVWPHRPRSRDRGHARRRSAVTAITKEALSA